MATMRLDFVSQDHMVFTGEVTEIMAPGSEGQLGILPRHAPLMTILNPGEVEVRRENAEPLYFAVSGGWMEVMPDRVTILARTAERSDEIDAQRAEEARNRAEGLLKEGVRREEKASVEMSLRRSNIRLRVANRRTSWHGTTGPGQDTQTRIE
jgi:F-type H+-transporting ATPase subunit epsilon